MTCLKKLMLSAATACVAALSATAANADSAILGPTGAFEQAYLNFILDHHYTGLRATELAAGTAVVGPTVSAPFPGNPPSFPPTGAKGTDPVVLDVAVRSNMAQGMEIVTGQSFLQDWYGSTAILDVPPSGQTLLATLEAAAAGDPFNIAFLRDFSGHHIGAIARSNECIRQAGHAELRAYCRMIATAQVQDVIQMRNQLSEQYGIDIDSPIPSVVPEPTSWAMMIAGFGFMGLALRHRTRRVRWGKVHAALPA